MHNKEYVRINGKLMDVQGKVEIDSTTEKQESVIGLDSVHGHKRVPKAPSMTMTLRAPKGESIESLLMGLGEPLTVVVQRPDGEVWRLTNAFIEGNPNLNSGELDVIFMGVECECIQRRKN